MVHVYRTTIYEFKKTFVPFAVIGEGTKERVDSCEAAIRCIERHPDVGIFFDFDGFRGESPIPNPLMMGANISEDSQAVEPTFEFLMGEAKIAGDHLLVTDFAQMLVYF